MGYPITTIKNYPDNGKHLECFFNSSFQIRKGEDYYTYKDKKSKVREYNPLSKKEIDDRWIVHLTKTASISLKMIFDTMVNKDLEVIIAYCKKVYKISLELELERIKDELKKLEYS